MKNKYPHFNPFMMGLMGGANGFLSGLGSYFDEQRKHQDKLDEITAHYSAMGSANAAKGENQKLMSAMKLEAGQRSYNVDTTDANGQPVRISYRNTYDPNTKSYSPVEIGRVPLSALQKNGAPVTRNFGDQVKQWNPETKTWDTVGSNANNSVSNREALRDKKIDDREAQRDARSKQEHLDSVVQRDMAAFDKADADTQAKMMKAAGVAGTVPDTDPHKTLMHPIDGVVDPNATKPNEDARQQYEDAITAKHAKRLGIPVPSDNSGASGSTPSAPANGAGSTQANGGTASSPAMTPDGRPIFKKDGQLFVNDKDGKKVPYNPAEGGSPLAMDEAHAQNQADSGDETGPSTPDDGSDPNAPGLMAGTESQASDDPSAEPDQEPDQDQDDEEPQGKQGLMA